MLFLTLWHVLTYKQADATLASLSILKYGPLKWPHRVIRGSKIKSAWILSKSMSDRRPWLKNSKNVIIFHMHGSVVRCCTRSKLVFRLCRGQKIKLLKFPENVGKFFIYLRVFRKRILCTIYLKCQVKEIWCIKKGLLPLANGDLWHFDLKTYEGDIGGSANYSFFWIPIGRRTIWHHFQ